MMETKPKIQKRNIAYKIWLSNLLNGDYVKTEGEFQSDYVEVDNLKISRINLIGTVVFRYESDDKNYLSITLDDGTFSIRLKTWQEDVKLLQNTNQGDLVLVIGKVRQYNEELYIIPEIVKILDNPDLELVRKLELLNEIGKPIKLQSEKIVETKQEVDEEPIKDPKLIVNRQKILELVESLSTDQGAKIDEVIEKSKLGEEAEQVLNDLLKDGEIYQPKPQYLKLLE
ncbi:MAG: OB-fold nucleic acid binding domain-containing protein [Candidatus Nanoarchaeia archaeon]|nr:OB-fold nucleic acid binding domain-containing protein [Candidatus Nanoarchaeia archaeon]